MAFAARRFDRADMSKIKTRAIKSKVEQLSGLLSELVALYRDPATAGDFAEHQAALSTTLTKHQLICTAIRCTDQSFASAMENTRPKR
jgi:hypothetical protein